MSVNAIAFQLLLITTVVILTTACDDNLVYQKELAIPDESWTYEEKLAFDFTIEDTLSRYTLVLEIAHSSDYGFQNLYVRMHTGFPSGRQETQVVSLELATLSGKWNGRCRGEICKVEIPLRVNTTFQESGKYQIVVEQFMRQNPLPGLKSMKLMVKKEE